jgi:hypothetical protein
MPSLQLRGESQRLLHVPQWLRSVSVFTQSRPHSRSPEPHVLHVPSSQTLFAHAVWHAPQFCASFERSAHSPAHGVWPSGQMRRHAPPSQRSSAAHRVAHAPQFSRSLLSCTQLAPHCTRPGGQTSHAPPTHLALPHMLWQVPQCAGSFDKFAHSVPHQASLLAQTERHCPD